MTQEEIDLIASEYFASKDRKKAETIFSILEKEQAKKDNVYEMAAKKLVEQILEEQRNKQTNIIEEAKKLALTK